MNTPDLDADEAVNALEARTHLLEGQRDSLVLALMNVLLDMGHVRVADHKTLEGWASVRAAREAIADAQGHVLRHFVTEAAFKRIHRSTRNVVGYCGTSTVKAVTIDPKQVTCPGCLYRMAQS